MAQLNSHGYGHTCRRLGNDWFVIGWSYDTKVKGSRLRFPRTIERHTDENGALKFCHKWNIEFPEPKAKLSL